jgi:translation initiation factor 2 alpha subunit (eIF-2alpha)
MEDTLWEIEKNYDNSNNISNISNILNTLLDKEENNSILILIKNQDITKIKTILDEYIRIKTVIVKPEKNAEISLTSYEIHGLSDIKVALDYKSFNFYKNIESDYDIEITYLSDSNYRISIKQIDVVLQNNLYDIDKVYMDMINEIKSRCLKSKIIIKN